MHRILRSAVDVMLLATVAVTSGCSDDTATSSAPPFTQARQPIVGGRVSDETQDQVVMLTHHDPDKKELWSCTATLIAPRLVLTAAHCVAKVDHSYFACDHTGAGKGGTRGATLSAETMFVYPGVKRLDHASYIRAGAPLETPAGVGMQILTDGVPRICNHDIALVVLKDPVAGAKIAPIRLDEDVTSGEPLLAVGYGYVDTGKFPGQRQQRDGIRVLDVGPFESPDVARVTPLPPNEFSATEGICGGDSGGPALSATTGAVLGVVSRGGDGTKQSATNPAFTCIGASAIYTKVSAFKELILEGFRLAEAEPWREGEPDPRMRSADAGCVSSEDCSPKAPATAARAPNDAGCSVGAPGVGARGAQLIVALGALTALRRRREKCSLRSSSAAL